MHMKTLIIYHSYNNGPCPDGIWAAWVAKKKYPEADLCPAIYGEELEVNEYNYDRLVIVDFSFRASQLQLWFNHDLEVILIDHHKTALNDLSGLMDSVLGNNRIVFDMEESGATLTWKTFFPDEPMPPVLQYVKDRDLWKHQLSSTAVINAALSSLIKEPDTMDALATCQSEATLKETLLPLGERLLKHKKEKVKLLASRAVFSTVAGYDNIPTVVLNDDELRYTSDVCAYLYKKYPEALFTACVDSEGKKVSLRSDKDGNNTDVGSIAKRFGGGGHSNSSGYTIS